jgi:D-alanyl-D-alanine carboxypeptidase-like protein
MRVLGLVLVGILLAGCGGAHQPTPQPDRTTVAATRIATATTTPTTPAPVRPVLVRRVNAADLGASWHPGCPVRPADLRAVTVPYYGFDGRRHEGTMVVATRVVSDVRAIFARLYAEHFPIRRMVPVSAYGGSDERSMEADNSSAFNCRPITGGTGWSKHAYGTAIDLNTLENPYVSGNTIEPTTARRFVDRSRDVRGMIHAGDPVVAVFAAHGWQWGGSWTNPTDYQHFELRRN